MTIAVFSPHTRGGSVFARRCRLHKFYLTHLDCKKRTHIVVSTTGAWAHLFINLSLNFDDVFNLV